MATAGALLLHVGRDIRDLCCERSECGLSRDCIGLQLHQCFYIILHVDLVPL